MTPPPGAIHPDTRLRATAPPSGPFCAERGLETPGGGALSITLDLPFPPSTNRIWRRSGGKIIKSKIYLDWLNAADMYVLSTRQFPKRKIHGPFRAAIRLNRDLRGRSDGDNRIKALLDWCQSRDLVRNDSDCLSGFWVWVDPLDAPEGCRITLWSEPDVAME